MKAHNVRYALVSGLIASIITTMISWVARFSGIGVGPEATWASLLGFGSSSIAWWLGFAVHVIMGSVIAVGYCWLFDMLDRSLSHWGVGFALGLIHANFVGFLLILSPKADALLFGGPSGIELPKVLAWIALHIIYGVTVWTLWEEIGKKSGVYFFDSSKRHPRFRPKRV